MYGDARRAEWAEFLSECDKYLAEVAKEMDRFTGLVYGAVGLD